MHVQECLFDELWEDTSTRIKSHGINVISINKYLKEVQGYSFSCCLELDNALAKAAASQKLLNQQSDKSISADKTAPPSSLSVPASEEEILDDIGGILWRFVFMRKDNIEPEHVMLMAKYVVLSALHDNISWSITFFFFFPLIFFFKDM